MADYTITYTDSEVKLLECHALDIDEWLTNFGQATADRLYADMLPRLVDHCNVNSLTLATGKDAQITQAIDLGLITKLTSAAAPTPE